MAEAAGPPLPASVPQPLPAAFFGAVAPGNPVVDSFEAELRDVLGFLRRLGGAGEAKPQRHDMHRRGANTLFNIWIKYKPRLPEWYYNEKLLKVGDSLVQIKEYKLALLQCYGRYLQQFVSINLDDIDDVHQFTSIFFPNGFRDKNAVLTFHALQERNVCIYQMVCSSDRHLQNQESLKTCFNVLSSLRLTMQVALPQENLCWLIYNGEKGVSGDAAVKFIKLAFSYEEWDVFDSAIGFVVNFLQAQDDPTWKKAEMELKLLTLMQPLLFPRKIKHDFSISENNTKETRMPHGSEMKQTFGNGSLKCGEPSHELIVLATTVFSCVSTSMQNIQPDEEILVDVIMFLWQKCKTGLQQIQMSGSDYLQYVHKYKAYQVL
uniref:Uncharacterized protein n=1 Tax=Falco tinnunculus TaxID=100819 RepID=A0A8C4TX57_FALTI